jgi:hypothetical protein
MELAEGADVAVRFLRDADGAESTKRHSERTWTQCHPRRCDVGYGESDGDHVQSGPRRRRRRPHFDELRRRGRLRHFGCAAFGLWDRGIRTSLSLASSGDADYVTGAVYVMDGGLNDQPSS